MIAHKGRKYICTWTCGRSSAGTGHCDAPLFTKGEIYPCEKDEHLTADTGEEIHLSENSMRFFKQYRKPKEITPIQEGILFPDEDEMTRYGFISHMESYIKKLLQGDLRAQPDEFLCKHGIDGPKAIEILTKRPQPDDENSAVLVRTEKIVPMEQSEEDMLAGKTPKDKFVIKYRLPRKDYTKKMRNLYIDLFENYHADNGALNEENANDYPELSKVTKDKEVFDDMKGDIQYSFGKNGHGLSDELIKLGEKIKKLSKNNNVYMRDAKLDACDDVYSISFDVKPINEDGAAGCAGATVAVNCNASAPVTPLFGKPIRKQKKIYMTEEQIDAIKEAVEMDTAFGDFGYDAPAFAKKGDPSMDHKNMMAKSWPGRKRNAKH